MEALEENSVLLIIDVQKGFDSPIWGRRNNPQAESNIAELLDVWRQAKRPVVHVRHMSTEAKSPLRGGQDGNEFKAEALPLRGEKIFEKQVNSAFIGTDLEAFARGQDYDTLVVVGLTTDHCVSTTTRMAGNLGFRAYVVADATATFDRTTYDGQHLPADTIHTTALASLHGEFATVLTTAEVLAACASEMRKPKG